MTPVIPIRRAFAVGWRKPRREVGVIDLNEYRIRRERLAERYPVKPSPEPPRAA